MIRLEGSINELTDEFRDRVQDLFENTDGVRDMTTESLARWVSEEFSKFLVEKDEPVWGDDHAWGDDDDSDDI